MRAAGHAVGSRRVSPSVAARQESSCLPKSPVRFAAHFRLSRYVVLYIFPRSAKRVLTSVFSVHYPRFRKDTLPCPQGCFRASFQPSLEESSEMSLEFSFQRSFDASFRRSCDLSDGRSDGLSFGVSSALGGETSFGLSFGPSSEMSS